MRRIARPILLAGVAALLPLVAQAPPAQAESAATTAAFAPPTSPMVLTRMLRRPLREGAEIVSLRSYLVRFTREGEETRVDGELLAATVEAPPGLQALAEIERQRPDTGLFPMRLDAAGLLLPGGAVAPGPAQREALAQAYSEIGGLPHLGPAETARARAFVGQLDQGAGHTPWPRDLFRPAPGARQEQRLIPLANGGRGHVTVDVEASQAGGVLAALSRKVTTDMEGDVRVTIEKWTLVAAPGR